MLVLAQVGASDSGRIIEEERLGEPSRVGEPPSMCVSSLSELGLWVVLFPPSVVTTSCLTLVVTSPAVSPAAAGCAKERGDNNGTNTTTNFNGKHRNDNKTAILYVCFAKQITEFISVFLTKTRRNQQL